MKLLHYWLLAILLPFSIFILGFRLSDHYQFNFDQERDYYAVKEIVTSKQTLIGPRAVSSAGFYLGPWYYYLQVPFFILFSQSPIYGAYINLFVSLTTVVVLYLFLSRKTSPPVSFVISLIWLAASHRTFWNVSFIPLFSIIYAIIITKEKPKLADVLLYGFLLGLGINFHFQLVLFSLPYLYLLFRFSKQTKNWLVYPYSLISFLTPFIPLFLFDLRHQFINSHAIINFFSNSTNTSSLLNQFLFSWRQIIRELSFILPGSLSYKFYVIPPLLIILALANIKKHPFLSLYPFVSILALSLYSNPSWPEYYHLSAVTISLILLALTINNKIPLFYITLICCVFINISNLTYILNHQEGESYQQKVDLMSHILSLTPDNLRPNISYEFPFGQGYGFSPIRDYMEKRGTQYYDKPFFVSYSNNPKQPDTKVSFGRFAVSQALQ